MRRTLIKTLTAAALAVAVLAVAPASAHALTTWGYPCIVAYNPAPTSTNYGTKGSVYVLFTSQAGCWGTMVKWGRFVTTGASSGLVGSDYHYSEAGILSIQRTLVDALANGLRVKLIHATSTSTVFQWLQVLAN